jgi:hypothetical protein
MWWVDDDANLVELTSSTRREASWR